MILRPDQSVGALYNQQEGTNEKAQVTISGAAASLNNKYFIFSKNGTNYYAWYNYNSTGVDPAVAGKTAVPVAIGVGATTAQIATATSAEINALTGITSAADGSVVNINLDTNENVTDVGAGDSGFTVAVVNQGHAPYGVYPAKNVDALSNVPSAIS